jgi:hypothetical protein
MAEDYYMSIGDKRYQKLEAARLRTEANIAEHQANGYDEAAEEELGALARIVADQQALVSMAQRRIQQLNPQQEEKESIITAKRAPSNGDEALEIINYGKMPDDPTRLTANEYNKQMHELNRLKAKGQYR